MGLFDWLKRLFGGGEDAPRRPRPPFRRPSPAPARDDPAPQDVRLGLDTGALTPLEGDALHAAAAALRGGMPWFWRGDRIPAADDPRTRVIDQGMLGRGLVDAEELAELHAIGAEYDALRPDARVAAQRGRRAVEAERAARRERKARLREEAAERRRLRAEEIARRKREDIVFLGRGVSAGLADRGSDLEKLRAAGLPELSTPAELAAALGVDIPRLRWLAFHAETAMVSHYAHFTVPKKSGGERRLASPLPRLAACQRWILDAVLRPLPTHEAAHGFVPGRSTVSNARPHVGRALVLNLDLVGFFPTLTFPRVRGFFAALGFSPAVATILALLCTACPRRRVRFRDQAFFVATGPRALPQGACTSPALSNLIARRLDARLAGVARKLGWRYTRYADDLSFSCDADGAERVAWMMAKTRHIAEDEGFAINDKKTRVLRRNARQAVTGIVVNERVAVPRKLRKRLRAILHRAGHTGLAAQNREGIPYFRAWLRGMIAYVHMVDPVRGGQLLAKLERCGD